EERQRQLLKAEAKEVAGSDGRQFEVRYQDPDGKYTPWRTVSLANKVEGDTPEARAKAFAERAGHLPDLSIEQIFPSSQAKEPDYKEGYSRFFNARTTEREPELVQATLDRLLREKTDGGWRELLKKINMQFDEKQLLSPGGAETKTTLTF